MGIDGLSVLNMERWVYRWVKRLEYGTVGIDGLSVLNMERWVYRWVKQRFQASWKNSAGSRDLEHV